jgi:hypothetical protein
MWTVTFWQRAAERAIKTGAQAAIAALVLTDPGAIGFDALAADWQAVASFAGGGLVLSLLTSLASSGMGPDKGDPSLV